jgi:hypothetical protein
MSRYEPYLRGKRLSLFSGGVGSGLERHLLVGDEHDRAVACSLTWSAWISPTVKPWTVSPLPSHPPMVPQLQRFQELVLVAGAGEQHGASRQVLAADAVEHVEVGGGIHELEVSLVHGSLDTSP